MKKTAMLAAAAALMAATPAAADGYLGLEYSNAEVDFIGSADFDTWQGEGAFGWTSGGWGGQIGGAFGNLDAGSGGDADTWSIDAHLYWHSGAWRIGGLIAATELDFGGGGSIDETSYGVEGMVDLGPNANLFARATVGEAEFLADADTWNFDFGGNFYASPNVRFGGFIGAGNLDFGGGGDADTFSAGINTEFQPWTAPVSVTLGYNYFEADDVSLESNAFRVGARWNFGGGTLQDRNNTTPWAAQTDFLQRLYGTW
jgi:hypothetical protein